MWFLIVALALGPAMLSLNTPADSTPAEAMEILLEDCDKSEYAENLVNYLDYILLGSAGYWDGELHLFTDMVTGKRPQRTSEDEFYNHAFLRISRATISANQRLIANEPEPGWDWEDWENEVDSWPGMEWRDTITLRICARKILRNASDIYFDRYASEAQ